MDSIYTLLLAIGLTASEKLDRTYLPPPGAQFSGGSPGDIQAPFEPPNFLQPGTIKISPNLNGPQDYGLKGRPGQVPVTTTSYAFTQTTTYPPIEGYETTVLPINSVTGIPVQNLSNPSNYQLNTENVPGYTQNDGQGAPSYNTIQSGSNPQGPSSNGQSFNIDNPHYAPIGNKPLSQYPNQASIIRSEDINQYTERAPQQPGINDINMQYPNSQPTSEIAGEYLNQNGAPGRNTQIGGPESQLSGVRQGPNQYLQDETLPAQKGTITSTASPQKDSSTNLPEQYIEIGPKGPFLGQPPQGAYPVQPIGVQDSHPQVTEKYQGKIGENDKQRYLTAEQNRQNPGTPLEQNNYQSDQSYNRASSSTPGPSPILTTSAYSVARPIIRPERPQAAGDRNAVILSYENVRTPNGYAYSYDTSNGIHADENGIVNDGTRAQGSYSYTGDDGKLYRVIYTADENGFQPRGDHLPTPPPIPEAIQKVIEQAARDKAAGIIDDGSYDEAKYGHLNYLPSNRRRPQIHGANNFKNNQIDGLQKYTTIPTSQINGNEYDDNVAQDQLSANSPKKSSGKHSVQRPSHKNTGEIDTADFNDNQSRQKISKEMVINPNFEEDNLTNLDDNNNIIEKHSNLRQPGTSEYNRISSSGVKTEDNIDNETPKIYDFDNGYNTDENSSKYYNPGQNVVISNTDLPVFGSRTQPPQAIVNGKRPQTNQSLNRGIVDDFVSERKDAPSGQVVFGQDNVGALNPNKISSQQIDANGYYYNPPQTQFSQTQFPTRFRDQDPYSTTKPMTYESFETGTTIKPFQTPDAYNKLKGNQKNSEIYEKQQSTTLKPFMTSRVTTEANSYSNYDDEEDYATGPDVSNEYISSTIRPNKKNSLPNQRPSQQNTLRPQYGQRTRINQKGTVAPSQEDNYYNTVQPVFSEGSSTQSSRFGSTESPKQNQRRPAASRRPSTSNVVGRPVTSSNSATKTLGSRYQTTNPSLGYPSSTVVPEYSTNKMQPGSESQVPYGQTGSIPQNYQSYTTVPTTAVTMIPGYKSNIGVFAPSETNQPSRTSTSQTGQRYEPIRSEYSMTGIPQRPTSVSYNSVMYPSSTPEFDRNYQQRPVDGTINNGGQLISSRPDNAIVPVSGTTTPQTPPNESYQTGYQYDAPTPAYTPTITSSTGRPNFSTPTDAASQRPYYTQPSDSGNGPSSSRPAYSTMLPPSTIGTTPGSFLAPTTPDAQKYYTTQSPYPSTQGIYNQSPIVDGFGRPISIDQQSTYPATGQEANRYPGTMLGGGNNIRGPSGLPSGDKYTDSLRPMYNGDQFANYPGYYGQSQVIGEDFSGPKQPQRFDPKTGYHY